MLRPSGWLTYSRLLISALILAGTTSTFMPFMVSPAVAAPTVTATLPAAGDSSVLAASGVKVTFSEAMDPASLNTGTVTVSKFTGIKAIAAGYAHTLLLRNDGTVIALGDNTKSQSTVPVTLSGVNAVAAGEMHSVALKSDGTVVAWGDNSYGQTTIPTGLSGVVAVAAGFGHTLALKSDGTVTGWGMNYSGQTTVPTGLSGVTAIAAGGYHSLALKNDGSVVAWGNNDYKQTAVPQDLSGVKTIAAGWHQSMALKYDGTITIWGEDHSDYAQNVSGIVAISCGESHEMILKNDNTVVVWGDNKYGQKTVPNGLSGVVAIAAGSYHSVVLKGNGVAVAWGRNSSNQSTIPVDSPLTYLAGTVSYDSSTATVTFTPTASFPSQAVLTATVSNSVRSLTGVNPSSDYSWSFLAGAAPVNYIANGSCGFDNGLVLTAPPANLCNGGGAVSAVAGAGPWNWSCSSGGTPSSCTAYLANTIPPVMTITALADGSVTNKSSLDIVGTITDTDGIKSLTVNNQLVTVAADGMFTAKVSLANGVNTITTIGMDNVGNTITDTRTITFDTTPPLVTISSLPDGSVTNNNTLNLAGTVSDPVGIKSLYINFQPVTVGANGSFSYPVALVEGSNTITAFVTDSANNTTTDTRTITLDTSAPALTITGPADNSITGLGSVTVTGIVSKTSVVQARIDAGAWQTAQMNGTTFSVDLNLAAGQNTIELTATDSAGNSVANNAKRTIIYDNVTPTLVISDPSQDITTALQTITLAGLVSDSLGYPTVTISHDGRVYSPVIVNGGFSQQLSFSAAKNYPIAVTATDDAGNSTSVTRNIIFVPNTVTFTAGPGGSISGAASQIIVEGGSTSEVRAIANTGHSFANWTGTNGFVSTTANPLTVATVANGMEITANFSTVNGSCGSDNGLALAAPPANLCKEGFASTVTGAGPWSWSCSDGGRIYACSAPLAGNSPPTLVVSALANGSVTNNVFLDLNGTISDSDGIRSLTVNSRSVAVAADGTFNATVTLAGGLNTIIIIGTDNVGNTTTDARTIAFNAIPPTLTISALADGSSTNNSTLNMAVTVGDSVGIKTLTINGQPVVVPGNNTFSHAVSLVAGSNTITTIAIDYANNTTTDIRTITLDTTVPVLVITAPADNSITGQGSVAVTGTVSVNSTVQARVGGGDWQTAQVDGTNFSILLNLAVGQNTIELNATDGVGNSVTNYAKRTIIYDTNAPVLAITYPSQDITTAQDHITISGTVSDSITSAAVSISFNGQTYTPPITNGTFLQQLTFTSEKNWPITVTAVDEVGNISTVTRNIIYVIPVNGTCGSSSGGTFAVIPSTNLCSSGVASGVTGAGPWSWSCNELHGGTTASCSASILTYNVIFQSGGNGTCGSSNGGVFTVAPTGNRCSTGTASSVTGSGPWNWSCAGANGGSTASCSAAISTPQDTTAPTLAMSTLADGSITNNATINISGTTTNAVGVKQVTVNGTAATLNTDGSFSQAVTLQSGSHTITTIATDIAGNAVTDTRTIILDITAPVLTIASPADNSIIGTSFVTITGTLNKPGTIQATVNNGSPQSCIMSGSDYSATLNLIAGLNTVAITATDLAGNSSSAKRTLVSDTIKPALTISDPAQDMTTTLGSYLVKGTTSDDNSNVTISVAVDGSNVTPAQTLSNGAFQQAVQFTTGKTYGVAVTATDGAGNTSTVQRNIIYRPLTVSDALRALHISLGIVQKTTQDDVLDVAPLVDGKPVPDGTIDISDAAILLRKSVGLVNW